MNKDIQFCGEAYDEFIEWAARDKKLFKKLNSLINEICRTPYDGTGKPELLRGNLSGFWSRRLDQKHRIVYQVLENENLIKIFSCYGHYEK